VRCNAAGLPIGIVLSEGEAHDVTAFEALMDQRDSDPGAMLADKGYDSDAIRPDLRDRGGLKIATPRLASAFFCGGGAPTPEVPTKRNRKVQQSVGKRLYALRARIECFIATSKSSGALPRDMRSLPPASWVSSCSDASASGLGLSTGPNPSCKYVSY